MELTALGPVKEVQRGGAVERSVPWVFVSGVGHGRRRRWSAVTLAASVRGASGEVGWRRWEGRRRQHAASAGQAESQCVWRRSGGGAVAGQERSACHWGGPDGGGRWVLSARRAEFLHGGRLLFVPITVRSAGGLKRQAGAGSGGGCAGAVPVHAVAVGKTSSSGWPAQSKPCRRVVGVDGAVVVGGFWPHGGWYPLKAIATGSARGRRCG